MEKIIKILAQNYEGDLDKHKRVAEQLSELLACNRAEIPAGDFAEGMEVVHFPSNMKGKVEKDGAGKLAFNFQGSFFPLTLKNVVRYGGKAQ